jgi:glycerol-3-phosphate cytidylyltransferase
MKKTGYAYVCADIYHIGHLKHLQRCKKYCDKLIVGVLTDKAVMEKKPKPIIGFKERLELVKNIKCVDKAIEQKTYSPIPNLKRLKPDIHFESTSHTKEAIKEARKILKVKVMPYYSKQSSTAIKLKIKKEYERT